MKRFITFLASIIIIVALAIPSFSQTQPKPEAKPATAKSDSAKKAEKKEKKAEKKEKKAEKKEKKEKKEEKKHEAK